MTCKISVEMAIELLEKYVEKVHLLSKLKDTNKKHAQEYLTAKGRVTALVKQIRGQGSDVDAILQEIKRKLNIKYSYQNITVHIDGAARGNDNIEIPNKSAAGFAVYGDLKPLHKEATYLGSEIELPQALQGEGPNEKYPATNNVAEYIALINALEYLVNNDLTGTAIEIYSDSNVVVQQVNKTNATRAFHLIKLRDYAIKLMDRFDNITLSHVPREENRIVDQLINAELDKHDN